MSDNNADTASPGDVQSIAEKFLESHRRGLRSNLAQADEQEIERLERRKEELDADDELYDIIDKRIQEKRNQLNESETDNQEVERRLLEAVASGFLAKGEWLDERILRALNIALHGKYNDVFVVDRQMLKEGRDLDEERMLEVSREVRELCRDRLENG